MAVQAREAFGRTAVRVRVQKRRTIRRKLWKRKPRTAGTAVPSGAQAARSRGVDRLAVQLAVCGGAFVLLVAAKLLLPGGAAALRQSLGGAMERNVDVREVFSAVGRAVSGEENGAEEVWQAVFGPVEPGAFGMTGGGPPDGSEAPDGAPDGANVPGGALSETEAPDGSRNPDAGSIPGGAGKPDSAQAVQSWSFTEMAAGTGKAEGTDALPDGTAYTVQPGQDGLALDVLRQYRPGNGNTEATEKTGNAEADRTDNAASETAENAEQQAENTEPPQTETPSGTKTGGPVLPEKVSMEQAILNFNYRSPVFGTLTSGFGLRMDPIQGKERFHHGVDLAVPAGTDILCFADGTVSAVGESTSYGKYCIVDHAGGCSTLYAHCSRITASSGAAVSMGEKIAEAGSTGAATGPHLHFELHKNGTYLNPIYYVSHD